MEEADLVFVSEGNLSFSLDKNQRGSVSSRNKLLLVSFDGFRWNYDQDVDTPNLDAMAAEGVKARYMTPAFITITSPCHFTLLTGRYLENHGVIHNMWFNTSTGQKLPYHSTQGVDSWWDNGSLPIWITAQRQGLKTGSIYFPGGRAKYQGEEVNMKLVEPLLFNYSNETNWRENIDTAMEWFTVNNLDFIALYFGEPDSAGHKYGPESTQRKNMIKQVDRTIGYLRQRIRESGLESKLNLIITSDHGMETVIKTNEIHIRTVENFTFQDIQFELLDYGPNGLLVPKEGKLEHVYSVLKNAHPNLHVYKKEDFPKRFHYANHPRITPLLLYGDPGYVIHGRYKVQFNKGEHGFDNAAMNMKTIFRAAGPAFRRGLEVEPFESVHVYALLCQLLAITPEPHDGSLEPTKAMLREPGTAETTATTGTAGSAQSAATTGILAGTATPGGSRPQPLPPPPGTPPPRVPDPRPLRRPPPAPPQLPAPALGSREGLTVAVSERARGQSQGPRTPPQPRFAETCTASPRADPPHSPRTPGCPGKGAADLLLPTLQGRALFALLPSSCWRCWESLWFWDAGEEHPNPQHAAGSGQEGGCVSIGVNASSLVALRVPGCDCKRNKDISFLLALTVHICLETHQDNSEFQAALPEMHGQMKKDASREDNQSQLQRIVQSSPNVPKLLIHAPAE
ncbi:ectonucleotide pyrophosphatase/phosphodiesterase family member 7 [Chlamydotis macqueenii]